MWILYVTVMSGPAVDSFFRRKKVVTEFTHHTAQGTPNPKDPRRSLRGRIQGASDLVSVKQCLLHFISVMNLNFYFVAV